MKLKLFIGNIPFLVVYIYMTSIMFSLSCLAYINEAIKKNRFSNLIRQPNYLIITHKSSVHIILVWNKLQPFIAQFLKVLYNRDCQRNLQLATFGKLLSDSTLAFYFTPHIMDSFSLPHHLHCASTGLHIQQRNFFIAENTFTPYLTFFISHTICILG